MDQHRLELVLEHSDSGSSAIDHFVESHSRTAALPPAVPAEPAFGPSRSHRVWRMMNALVDAVPEWADQDTFEADRTRMLQYGLSIGMTLEQLYTLSDPDTILGLWTAAEAQNVEV
ncbi:hypothetical protein KHP60_14270 [Microvirga sp. 3-52]|uniref:hypothetical protein n=1 Tax=Microvirga sp. 3-52 TaxID=2792425 RepID=UPI001AC96CB1|nr:hypothetical protein [Microvirga sp. 3-52]MBO1906334.1 hypothetical protein [Microvirga sp. 3-52]MBS7453494.1 hypothetical protein [Microvirga sp. 3-52]